MATQALSSSHALSSHIADVDDASVAASPSAASRPTLMRRLFDAFTASQMRRAEREIDRILGRGAMHRAFHGELPLDR